MNRFICRNEKEPTSINLAFLQQLNITCLNSLHFNSENISKLALLQKKSNFITLPFCSTLEAEVLGASPKLTLGGASINSYAYKSLNDIPREFNFEASMRLNTMLSAIEKLSGEPIIFNLEGPFTIITSLINLKLFFKVIKKDKFAFLELLSFLEDFIVAYGKLLSEKGVKVLSFGDPMASIDIVGPKIFSDIYKNCCISLLMRLKKECPNSTIHLCGKLTQNFIDINSCYVREEALHVQKTYGNAILDYTVLNKNDYIIGLNCLNNLNKMCSKLYLISF